MLKKKIILLFLTTFLLIIFAIPASAVSVYKMQYTIPQADEYSGYMEALFEDPNTGNRYVYTYFVRLAGLISDRINSYDEYTFSEYISEIPYVTVKYNSSTKYFDFTYDTDFYSYAGKDYVRFNIMFGYFDSSGDIATNWRACPYDEEHVEFSIYGPQSFNLLSYQLYGNFIPSSSTDFDYYKKPLFTVIYGSDTLVNNKLDAILASIKAINNDDIIANQDKNSDEIQANQDKNTDKQIQADKDAAQAEKNEASASDGKVSDVTGAVPDVSSGALPAIQSLVSAMSYNGTSVGWKFPALSLPAIPGVMNAIPLTPEMPIPFEDWFNMIPEGIMAVVRALFDIALVLYCVYELYKLIKEIMVNRGGGGSE